MPTSTPLSIDGQGVLDLMRKHDALRTWELIRVSRAPITVPELTSATHMDARVLHRHLDLLMRHRLVQRVRARKPRRTSGYRVTCDRIVLASDDAKPQSVARATQSADSVRDEFARCVTQCADTSFHPKEGFRFRLHCMKRFTPEDLAELRRLMIPVVAFLSTPRPGRTRQRMHRACPALRLGNARWHWPSQRGSRERMSPSASGSLCTRCRHWPAAPTASLT